MKLGLIKKALTTNKDLQKTINRIKSTPLKPKLQLAIKSLSKKKS